MHLLQSKEEYENAKRLKRRMVYSPALAVSTALLVFLQVYRDLTPVPTQTEPQPVEQRG